MPKKFPDDADTAWSNFRQAPRRAPRELERLASVCLKAEAEDSRLGDLSERYVRTHERARMYLGTAPLGMTVSHLAADIRYLFSAANVMLFARAVDPVLRLAEPGAKATIALDLKERTMTLLHTAARKLVLPALLLVGSAFLINGAVNAWTTWRETESLIIGLQREKAEAAAAQIGQHFAALQDMIGWTTMERGSGVPPEHRRNDYLRLLRQVPAITEVAKLNAEGKEVLSVSRLRMDKFDSGADFSGDARFTEALKRKMHVGPVYFNKQSEPFVSLAVAHAGSNPGVTLAEVGIKRLWNTIDTIKVGETGYAYVVDEKGRLIASRDRALVLRQADLSALPQVIAASAVAPSGTSGEGVTFDTSPSGAAVISVHATVPTVGWKVFVELPVAEARAPLWTALARVAFLLGLGVLAIFLASFAAARRAAPAQPART